MHCSTRRPACGLVMQKSRGLWGWPSVMGDPGSPHFSTIKRDHYSMNTTALQNAFAESKMNVHPLLNRANLFEAGLFSWGIPEQTARELTAHHTETCYESGKLIFSQGSSADIVLWVVNGVVREICPNPNGTQTLVRLATAGDILGLADKLNEKGQWVRRFEAWTASKCVIAIFTRQHVRDLLKGHETGGTAGIVRAHEFGIFGMDPLLRDLPGTLISRAD